MAAPTGRLPDLPTDESVWDGPFRGEDEVKEEPAGESHSPCGEQGGSQCKGALLDINFKRRPGP